MNIKNEIGPKVNPWGTPAPMHYDCVVKLLPDFCRPDSYQTSAINYYYFLMNFTPLIIIIVLVLDKNY